LPHGAEMMFFLALKTTAGYALHQIMIPTNILFASQQVKLKNATSFMSVKTFVHHPTNLLVQLGILSILSLLIVRC